MGNDELYRFPDYMQAVYSDVHEWLGSLDESVDFRFGNVKLKYEDIREVGNHLHKFFPAHYFKVSSALKETVTYDTIKAWLKDDGRICVVDIGCGSGAASSAFIETLRNIIIDSEFTAPIHVHLIGLEPVEAALVVYRTVLDRIKKHADLPRQLKITHEFLCEKLPNGAQHLIDTLVARRINWDQPYLSRAVLMQVNTVSSYAEQGVIQDVAQKHLEIFTETPIDHIHLLTIVTKDWKPQFQEMDRYNLHDFCSHTKNAQQRYWQQCSYVNPENSFYRTDGNCSWYTKYHCSCISVSNIDHDRDTLWQRIIAYENLALAWARARNALLRESLVDEVEIRLRDRDVDRFLKRLQFRLIAYAEDIFHPSDQVFYEFPKGFDSFRPMSLSRFEEEILSVAIIQAIGEQYERGRKLYAHQLNYADGNKSEFLYKYWGYSYKSYVDDARKAACFEKHATVLRTDIKSYYTNIEQTRLVNTTVSETNIASNRVQWLLRKVLCKFLDPEYHHKGYGLAQGGTGSGFFANIYLAIVDEFFLEEIKEDVTYFRYADDMILVVPRKQSVEDEKSILKQLLGDLGLALNCEKTKSFPITKFDEEIPTALSNELDQLSHEFNSALMMLWELASYYYNNLNICDNTLYDFLALYLKRLRELSFVASIPMLRRKLLKYQQMPMRDFAVAPPEFGEPGQEKYWAMNFVELYPEWINGFESLRSQYEQLVAEIVPSSTANLDSINDKNSTRLRFALSRLCRLGISNKVAQIVADILERKPSLLRHQSFVLQSLAEFGHRSTLESLYDRFSSTHPDQTYLRAMLVRAMRYFDELPPLVFKVAFDANEFDIVRLMATESMLAFDVRELSAGDWVKVNNILSNEPLMPRLRKNLILLLRQVGDRDPHTFKPRPGEDEILFDAWNVPKGTNIFEKSEPSILKDYFDPEMPDDAYEFGDLETTFSF